MSSKLSFTTQEKGEADLSSYLSNCSSTVTVSSLCFSANLLIFYSLNPKGIQNMKAWCKYSGIENALLKLGMYTNDFLCHLLFPVEIMQQNSMAQANQEANHSY